MKKSVKHAVLALIVALGPLAADCEEMTARTAGDADTCQYLREKTLTFHTAVPMGIPTFFETVIALVGKRDLLYRPMCIGVGDAGSVPVVNHQLAVAVTNVDDVVHVIVDVKEASLWDVLSTVAAKAGLTLAVERNSIIVGLPPNAYDYSFALVRKGQRQKLHQEDNEPPVLPEDELRAVADNEVRRSVWEDAADLDVHPKIDLSEFDCTVFLGADSSTSSTSDCVTVTYSQGASVRGSLTDGPLANTQRSRVFVVRMNRRGVVTEVFDGFRRRAFGACRAQSVGGTRSSDELAVAPSNEAIHRPSTSDLHK